MLTHALRLSFLFVTGLALTAAAQTNGTAVYSFLNLSPSARSTALGGANVSLAGVDPAAGYLNPALLSDTLAGRLQSSVAGYPAGITAGNLTFVHTLNLKQRRLGYLQLGMQYVNYGSIPQTDELGNVTGTFSANELALYSGVTRDFGHFHTGGTFKLIYSNLAGRSSFGLAVDFGASYSKGNFSAGLVLRNVGAQLTPYYPGASRSQLPYNLEAGISQRLAHAPLRLSVTASHLEKPNLTTVNESPSFVTNALRHLTFAGELLLSKSFEVRLSYSTRRRQELNYDQQSAGLGGLALGFGLHLARLGLDYAYSTYGAIGGINQLTVALRVGR